MIAELWNTNKSAALLIDTYKKLGLIYQRALKPINCRKADTDLVFICTVFIL
jgi:hypothetical protein